MKRSHVIVFSPAPYTQDIQLSILRGHKYYRVLKQFNENEDVSKKAASLFLKTIKQAKTIRAFKLQIESYPPMRQRLGIMQSYLKQCSRTISELDISTIACPNRKIKGNLLLHNMKKLKTVFIPNDAGFIKKLAVLRHVEIMLINMMKNKVQTEVLYKALVRLVKLKNLSLLVLPTNLNDVLSVLDKFSVKFDRPTKFQMITKEHHEYNQFPDLSLAMVKKISKLSFQYLHSETVLNSLLIKQAFNFANLRSLKVSFSTPDMKLVTYLEHIGQVPLLEKLSLSFAECWRIEFIEGVIKHLHLPVLLQDFKLTMPLSLKNFIPKDLHRMEEDRGNSKYPWREINFFEEDPFFISFFLTLEQANYLRKVEFDFQMIENFSSYYTNLFVSILNRLPNLSSFVFHVTDFPIQSANHIPEVFDLALLFQACSRIRHLEHLEVLMPNLLFEDAEINYSMAHLKSFNIGVIENEDEGVLKLQDMSKLITGWLKRLLSIAPNLSSLIFDFTEILDEPSLLKRFMLIERFKQLEGFCSRLVIRSCSVDTAKKIGKILQSLHRLNTIVMRFLDSDKNILELRRYLNQQKSIREILISFGNRNWIGKEDKIIQNVTAQQEEDVDSLYASGVDEPIGFEAADAL